MQVVLVHPQIPQNTGTIARTCAATQTPLHLVHPLGFEISEKRVRRAGLDYWPYVQLTEHQSWQDYLDQARPAGRLYTFSKFASRPYHQPSFSSEDALIFGAETTGLPREIIETIPDDQRLQIPMKCSQVRSLNLSNAVSIGLFEALRQTGAL